MTSEIFLESTRNRGGGVAPSSACGRREATRRRFVAFEAEGEEVAESSVWESTGLSWHVIHTKPRQEKALANSLSQMKIAFFLPLLRQTRIYGHRRRRVEIPLFSGYLFLRGSVEATYAALDTKRAVRAIRVVDQDTFNHEMRQIDLALKGQGVLDPYPFIKVGRRVRVKSGPFCGLEGLVDERKRGDRIILIVQTIGQATSLEIDASLLEAID